MVSSISSSSPPQATYAPAARNNPDQAVATPAVVTTTDDQGDASAPTQSAESAASARLGEQLNAQADASRVQRAVEEASTDSGTTAAGTTAAAPAGGAPAAASTATSTTSATTNDYVAEADTNSDKTISDDEQAAYDTRLRQQAEAAAATKAAATKEAGPQDALSAEVRATYGVDEATGPVLNVAA
jgi:hypothetical protein